MHLLYGSLLVCSFLIDPFCRSVAPGWQSPSLHIYPAAMALIWLTVWFARRLERERARRRELEERLRQLEHRLDRLDRDRADETRWPP